MKREKALMKAAYPLARPYLRVAAYFWDRDIIEGFRKVIRLFMPKQMPSERQDARDL